MTIELLAAGTQLLSALVALNMSRINSGVLDPELDEMVRALARRLCGVFEPAVQDQGPS